MSLTNEQLASSIYVKGIPDGCTEDDMHASFSPFGAITEVTLLGERRYGFIQFSSADSVAAAVAASVAVAGVDVIVEARQPRVRAPARESAFLYLNNLGEYTREEDITQVLGEELVELEMHADRGFCYAEMASIEAARDAVATSPVLVNGQSIGIQMRRSRLPRRAGAPQQQQDTPVEPTMSIYVRGVNDACTEEDLIDAFSAFGEVQGAVVKTRTDRDTGDLRYYAFVDFDSTDAVTAAVEAGPTVSVCGFSGLTVEARRPRRAAGGGGGRRRRSGRGGRNRRNNREAAPVEA